MSETVGYYLMLFRALHFMNSRCWRPFYELFDLPIYSFFISRVIRHIKVKIKLAINLTLINRKVSPDSMDPGRSPQPDTPRTGELVAMNQSNSAPSRFCRLPIGPPDIPTDSRVSYIAEWIVAHFPQFKSIVFPCNPIFVDDQSVWRRQKGRGQKAGSRGVSGWRCHRESVGISTSTNDVNLTTQLTFFKYDPFLNVYSADSPQFRPVLEQTLPHQTRELSENLIIFGKVEQIPRIIKLESLCSLGPFRNP
jgi:hypothetical protein